MDLHSPKNIRKTTKSSYYREQTQKKIWNSSKTKEKQKQIRMELYQSANLACGSRVVSDNKPV